MKDQMGVLFVAAFRNFQLQETDNISHGVSERNLCGRLAMYLDREKERLGLDGCYADVEYNRKQGGQLKTILDGNMQVITITCDLILHSRGESVARDNLIAIEMKKSDRPEAEKNSDRNRLRAMTKASFDDVWSNDGATHPEHVCGYEMGVFIEIDAKHMRFCVEEFRAGEFVQAYEGHFGNADWATVTTPPNATRHVRRLPTDRRRRS